jgi:hypothetical protein
MNTSGINAPAIVISVGLLVAALATATLFHGWGLSLGYVLPGFFLLAAALTPLSVLMAKQCNPGSRTVCHHTVHG